MKTFLLLLIFISYTSADLDKSTLTSLQTLDHWNTFRIVLPHTADECFYLETKLNDTIHVIYQVLKGGDSLIRTIITDPFGHIVFARAGSSFGWYDEERSKVLGAYEICFKNEQYFTTKILYIGVLATHIDRLLESAVNAIKAERNNETAIIEEFSTNAMKSLGDISTALYQLTAYQIVARVHHAHDLYSIEINANYVQKWALCQILTMIICSIIQVFSIRRLFKSTKPNKTTSSYKKSNPNFSLQSSDYFIIPN